MIASRWPKIRSSLSNWYARLNVSIFFLSGNHVLSTLINLATTLTRGQTLPGRANNVSVTRGQENERGQGDRVRKINTYTISATQIHK